VTPYPVFGRQTFEHLLLSLLQCADVHLDILLVVRDEIFCRLDCVFYTFLILRQQLGKVKKDLKAVQTGGSAAAVAERSATLERSAVVLKNILDIIRMVDFDDVVEQLEDVRAIEEEPLEEDGEEEEEEEGGLKRLFLVVPHALSGASLTAAELAECSSDESDPEEDAMDEDASFAGQKRKAPVGAKAKLAQKSAKREKEATANRKMNRAAQLKDLGSYKRAFSGLWLSLLSVGTVMASMAPDARALKQANDHNKLILKHLCNHVVPHLSKPLLLADYLTSSYRLGTNAAGGNYSSATAILALESLFQLIVQHNLDYPSFFQSLYGLCTVEVFSGSYRGKFLKLLHMSLKSGNLPAYTVASFAKRLMFLATQGASVPCAAYCVAQTCWLLRAHPQCMPLLQRQGATVMAAEDSVTVEYGEKAAQKPRKAAATPKAPEAAQTDFNTWDFKEDEQLEQTNALGSSLFELEILKLHYYAPIAEMVSVMESNFETTQLNSAVSLSDPWNCNTYLKDSYDSLIEKELSMFTDAKLVKERKKHYRKGKASDIEGTGASDQLAAVNYRVTDNLIDAKSLCGRCFG
jgi:hypothetical protein